MKDTRDYQDWHRRYDDPESSMSWRLERVRHHISDALDQHPGGTRVLSVCAGDGGDLLGVLAGRADSDRVASVLLELHPDLAQRARDAAAAAGLTRVEVRTVDASTVDSYVEAAPADIVLLVGIFGNVSDEDVWRLVAFAAVVPAGRHADLVSGPPLQPGAARGHLWGPQRRGPREV